MEAYTPEGTRLGFEVEMLVFYMGKQSALRHPWQVVKLWRNYCGVKMLTTSVNTLKRRRMHENVPK